MKVFQHLIEINYSVGEETASPSCSARGEESLSDIESEILHYTGGRIVHSLKQKCLRANQTNTQAQLETLDCFLRNETPSESSTCKTLTQLFDTGWLSYVKHSVAGLLRLLGLKFRSKLSSGQCNSGQSVKDCLDDRVLVTAFYQICYEVQTDEESKESVLEGVLKLSFKIRIHNRCKYFMGEYRNRKHVSKTQKCLQMNLTKSGESSSPKQTWPASKGSQQSSFIRLVSILDFVQYDLHLYTSCCCLTMACNEVEYAGLD